MLQRLERADRHAELLARLQIFERAVARVVRRGRAFVRRSGRGEGAQVVHRLVDESRGRHCCRAHVVRTPGRLQPHEPEAEGVVGTVGRQGPRSAAHVRLGNGAVVVDERLHPRAEPAPEVGRQPPHPRREIGAVVRRRLRQPDEADVQHPELGAAAGKREEIEARRP